MSEQQQPQEQQGPVFSIEKVYVKDLSLEVPNSPQCFMEQVAPEIDVQLQTVGTHVGEYLFDVSLSVTVTARTGENTLFLVEVAQGGLFYIRDVPEDELEPVLGVACPNILFPFAREAVADAISRAGFPPILLAPVSFENMYRQRLMAQQQGGAGQGPHEVPIQ